MLNRWWQDSFWQTLVVAHWCRKISTTYSAMYNMWCTDWIEVWGTLSKNLNQKGRCNYSKTGWGFMLCKGSQDINDTVVNVSSTLWNSELETRTLTHIIWSSTPNTIFSDTRFTRGFGPLCWQPNFWSAECWPLPKLKCNFGSVALYRKVNKDCDQVPMRAKLAETSAKHLHSIQMH